MLQAKTPILKERKSSSNSSKTSISTHTYRSWHVTHSENKRILKRKHIWISKDLFFPIKRKIKNSKYAILKLNELKEKIKENYELIWSIFKKDVDIRDIMGK